MHVGEAAPQTFNKIVNGVNAAVRAPADGLHPWEATMMARRLRPVFITLATLPVCAPTQWSAQAQDTLKVAIPLRGAWDAGLAELGQRGGIFKKHGLNLEILYVQAGPESIQARPSASLAAR
jgi:hypothetical protein